MPKIKTPSKLENVCYESIVSHMDVYWAADYLSKIDDIQTNPLYLLGPFDDTPPKFLERILHDLLSQNKLRKHHLDLLLLPSVKWLSLAKWNSLNTFLSKSHYGIKLRNLTYLDLSSCQIPRNMFQLLAQNIPNIETLNLSGTKCDDKVLSYLGSNSPNLRQLDLENCSNVSDWGLYSLILTLNDLDQEQLRCVKITDLNIQFTGITKKGAACAMINLPYLVNFKNENTLEALEYALKSSHAPEKFAVENLFVSLSSNSVILNVAEITPKQLELATNHLPCVKTIQLQDFRICRREEFDYSLPESLNYFIDHMCFLSKEIARFEQLRELHIHGNPNEESYSFLQVYDFLKIRGYDLTHISIHNLHFSVDLVGLYCPNLISLELEMITEFENLALTQRSPVPYAKLESLSINFMSTMQFSNAVYNVMYFTRECNIEEHDFITLVANCSGLKRLQLQSLTILKDELFDIVLASNPLLQLEYLHISDNSFVSDVTIEKFVKNKSNLKKIIYTGLKNTTKLNQLKLEKFVRENNLDVKLFWQ